MIQTLTSRSVSRRVALGALGAGLVRVLAWPAAVRAREKSIPEFSFAVVSDTHLGRDDLDVGAKNWKQTVQEINSATGDFALHLGDVVDNAREAQYAVYKDIRKSLRRPIYEIPGNHDPQALFEQHIRRDVDTSFDHRGIRFLLFNNSRYGETDGFISTKQNRWLSDQCDEAAKRDLFVVIAMHVPAHDNTDHGPAGSFVKPANGQKDFYDLLDRHKSRVLALVHGHFHCGLRGWDSRSPLQEVVFPSTLYNRNLFLGARRAPGFNLPEFRPGYVLVEIGKDGLTLRYKPVGIDGTQKRVLALDQFRS